MEKAKRSKISFSTILLIIIASLVVIVVVAKLCGVKTFVVTSPSMEPAIGVGELIVTVPVDFEALKKKDIVTYVMNIQLDTATHRIIEINDADKTVITQGDNNDIPDGKPVKYENIVGRVALHIPIIGYAFSYISTTTGKITVVAALIIIIILSVAFSGGNKGGEKDSPKQPLKQEPDDKQ